MFNKEYFENELAKRKRQPEQVVSLASGFFNSCNYDPSLMTPDRFLDYIKMNNSLYRDANRAKFLVQIISKSSDPTWTTDEFENALILSSNLSEETKLFIHADQWNETENNMYEVAIDLELERLIVHYLRQNLAWYGMPVETEEDITHNNFTEKGIQLSDRFIEIDSPHFHQVLNLYYTLNPPATVLPKYEMLTKFYYDKYKGTPTSLLTVYSSGLIYRLYTSQGNFKADDESIVGFNYLKEISKLMYGWE